MSASYSVMRAMCGVPNATRRTSLAAAFSRLGAQARHAAVCASCHQSSPEKERALFLQNRCDRGERRLRDRFQERRPEKNREDGGESACCVSGDTETDADDSKDEGFCAGGGRETQQQQQLSSQRGQKGCTRRVGIGRRERVEAAGRDESRGCAASRPAAAARANVRRAAQGGAFALSPRKVGGGGMYTGQEGLEDRGGWC